MVKFVTSDDPSESNAAIDENAKAIFVETIGNPKYNISPVSEIAKVCMCTHTDIEAACRLHTRAESR